MSLANSVSLIGHLGKDVELKKGQFGPYCTFSMATKERVKKGDAWEDQTTWHFCKVSGKQAENLGKLGKKGREITVRGSLTYWKKDDDSQTAVIKVEEFRIHGPKVAGYGQGGNGNHGQAGGGYRGQGYGQGGNQGGYDENPEDIPPF